MLMTVTLDDKYTALEGSVYLTGIQALVRLAIDQQRRDAGEGLRTGHSFPGTRAHRWRATTSPWRESEACCESTASSTSQR